MAERGPLDFITIDDTLALQSETYGPPIPRTKHIGLIPTAVVTHSEPFHLAKAIATLDFVSKGRAGVRLKVGVTGTEAKLFGRRDISELTLSELGAAAGTTFVTKAFDEAVDYGEVIRRLWDSWDDDAEIRDQSTGRFIDRDKVHYIDFQGEHFSVKGPLTVPRPPQGQPIVGVLAHSTDVYRLGVEVADLMDAWTTADLDGIRVRPAGNAIDLPLISDALVPELQHRDLRPNGYSANTLRGTLGLDRPLSGYAPSSEVS